MRAVYTSSKNNKISMQEQKTIALILITYISVGKFTVWPSYSIINYNNSDIFSSITFFPNSFYMLLYFISRWSWFLKKYTQSVLRQGTNCWQETWPHINTIQLHATKPNARKQLLWQVNRYIHNKNPTYNKITAYEIPTMHATTKFPKTIIPDDNTCMHAK